MLAVRWRPFSRLLELKNTKTAGRDFFRRNADLGFSYSRIRILGFDLAHTPPRTPTSRVGKRRLMSPILPVYGGIRGRIFVCKVPSDRLFGDGGRFYKGVVVGNDRTFRG
ncbi:hypothetical protein BGK40_09270 [Corynebacterium diphtheriae]|nr:hypothetical protein BGK40_09270 [Corynebacterium diphtheriae]